MTTAQTVIAICAGSVAMLAATAKGGAWAVRRLRRLFRLVDQLLGVPGDQTRPGLMAKVDENTQRLAEVQERTAEWLPNGGTSARDVLDRVDDRTERLEQRVEHLGQRLTAVERLAIPDRPDDA